MTSSKTAGIIIIGNEILSAKVQDANSFYLASELRELGVDLIKISVIPDDIDMIGRETLLFSKSYDFVFTTGGVGPTHDDVTMEGIATGFKVDLVDHPVIVKLLHRRYENMINAEVLKMAKVPAGSSVYFDENMRFPIVSFKNIYIFPGIPEYLRNKFPYIRERLRSTSFYLKRIFLKTHESVIANTLNSIVKKHTNVIFGSYPVVGNPEYSVIITAESRSDNFLTEAVDDLLNRLSVEFLVAVE